MANGQPWCRIVPEAAGYSLRFACGEAVDFRECVDDLKARIPPRLRAWKPEARSWWVAERAWFELREWAEEWFAEGEPQAHGRQRGAPRPHPAADSRTEAYRALHLLPTAPPELVKAAYRVLALLNHPDKGGDTETMRNINVAYELLVCEAS
jgi:hypothetical protein